MTPTLPRERIAVHLGLSPFATDAAIIAAARRRYPDLPPPVLAARLGHVAYPPPRRRLTISPALPITALILVGAWAGARLIVPGGHPVAALAVAVVLYVGVARNLKPKRRPRPSTSTEVVRR